MICPSSHYLNLADISLLEKLQAVRPDIIVNAAALTDVEGAERNVAHAYQLNAEGPKYLAEACQRLNVPLIHLSTDYVFSGLKNLPYTENDLPDPINVYGKSKLAGEVAVLKACEKSIVLRTSWVFGLEGSNFIKIILKLANERSIVNVIENEISCPTDSMSVAHAILKIATMINCGASAWGTYHFCGYPAISRYHYAIKILEIAKKYSSKKFAEINGVNSDQFVSQAARPDYSAMSSDKIFKVFNIAPHYWHASLAHIIQILLKNCIYNNM